MAHGNLYYFRFHAHPRSGHPRVGAYGGAMVNCWIDRPTVGEAEAAARALIEENGWVIVSSEERVVVNGSYYLQPSEGLRYYEQALLDKEVLVFHTYAVGKGPGDGD